MVDREVNVFAESLDRWISFQPLLKLVPPLNSREAAHSVWNMAFSVIVTHQSFSIAYSGRLSASAV